MQMKDTILLLSIRPKYARRIFAREKTVELRRVRPRVAKGSRVLVYVSSPVKALLGMFEVHHVIKQSPEELWRLVRSEAALTRKEFDEYYNGVNVGYAIFFSKVAELQEPIRLGRLRQLWPNFRAPQGYRYIESGEFDNDILDQVLSGLS